ncbi:MAG: hypothetical protein WCT16_03260 [Candidatus Buchananbacteria bacterium]
MNKEVQKFQSVCVMGACPEVLKTDTVVKLRNSSQTKKFQPAGKSRGFFEEGMGRIARCFYRK